MKPLRCEMCNGELVMDESGEFATCMFCGMKYTKEVVKGKIQGIVEIVKGEAEKERLLRNAKTWITLEKYYEAERIFEKLIDEFPDDWRVWAEYSNLYLFSFPLVFSHNDYVRIRLTNTKVWLDNYKTFGYFSDAFKRFNDFCENANKLSSEDYIIFDNNRWKEYQIIHTNYIQSIEEDENNGDLFFDKIEDFLLKDNYIPEDLVPLLNRLRQNATIINTELSNKKNKFENIWRIGFSSFNPKSADITLIDSIKYLSKTEAIVHGCFSYDSEYGMGINTIRISFNSTYSNDELLNVLLRNTDEEQKKENIIIDRRNHNVCVYCGGHFKGIIKKTCTNCGREKNY